LSKRGCNNDKSIFDLKLLFIIAKKKAPKLVWDLQTKFIELYSHKNKNIEISLNEVYVELVEE
jgi:hypothetical protein